MYVVVVYTNGTLQSPPPGYDGDVMVAVGDVDYTWGREAISQYNESYAGARTPSWAGVSGPKNVDPIGPDGKIIKSVISSI
jgi:hypothetical protein